MIFLNLFRLRSLEDLVPELGGMPIRNLIITTWRSGSTFLGDILNSHPANFYHYEPLLDYEIVQIREEPKAGEAIGVLKNLLNCNYTGLGELLFSYLHLSTYFHSLFSIPRLVSMIYDILYIS